MNYPYDGRQGIRFNDWPETLRGYRPAPPSPDRRVKHLQEQVKELQGELAALRGSYRRAKEDNAALRQELEDMRQEIAAVDEVKRVGCAPLPSAMPLSSWLHVGFLCLLPMLSQDRSKMEAEKDSVAAELSSLRSLFADRQSQWLVERAELKRYLEETERKELLLRVCPAMALLHIAAANILMPCHCAFVCGCGFLYRFFAIATHRLSWRRSKRSRRPRIAQPRGTALPCRPL